MRSLTLIGKMLLYIEVNSVFIGLNSEYGIIQLDFATRIGSALVENAQLHYFSTIM
jgi:hypothetical protein